MRAVNLGIQHNSLLLEVLDDDLPKWFDGEEGASAIPPLSVTDLLLIQVVRELRALRQELATEPSAPAPVAVPARIPFGSEGGVWAELTQTKCPDCGTRRGELHHPGCDIERCEFCGGQVITCGCHDDDE